VEEQAKVEGKAAKPVIMTSSWYSRLSSAHARIGISRGTPRGQKGYKRLVGRNGDSPLNPGSWFNRVDTKRYHELYMEQLSKLNPQEVVEDILALADGLVPTLLCYESATQDFKDGVEQWCHRGLVSGWLKDTLDIDVHEVGRESCGCGWSHPKVPRQFRFVVVEDRTADIQKFFGETFVRNRTTYTVTGMDPERADQVIVTSARGVATSAPVDTILKYLSQRALDL
jgi:hypothetical protein